jgi:hypothetical protein
MTSDVTPPAPVQRKCVVWGAHAALWTEDPALMGVVDVEVRKREAGASPEQACAPAAKGGRRFSDADKVYDPVGAVGRHLVTLYPDGLGVLSSFSVLDMDSGALLLEDQFNVEKGIDLARTATGASISWWTRLDDVPCVPRRGESGCWTRILAAARVPPSVRVPQPDCEAIVARNPGVTEKPYGIVQITVHTRGTLGRPGRDYLPDPATCDASE